MGESQVTMVTRPPGEDMLRQKWRWPATKMGVRWDELLFKQSLEGGSLTLWGVPVAWGPVAKDPEAGELVVGQTNVTVYHKVSGEQTGEYVLADIEARFAPEREQCDELLNGPATMTIKAVFVDTMTLLARTEEKRSIQATIRRVREMLRDEPGHEEE